MPARRQTHPDTVALLQSRAASMRAHPTLSEQALWAQLSGSKLGVAFRRQVVVGRFIVDFAAPRARLVVEVDGGYHQQRVRLDARREAELRRRGWRILRLSDELVVRDTPRAVALVREALAAAVAAAE